MILAVYFPDKILQVIAMEKSKLDWEQERDGKLLRGQLPVHFYSHGTTEPPAKIMI